MGDTGVADLVRHGVAVVVATRDGALRPELGRAWGPTLSDDAEHLTVCVESPPGSVMARNLETGAPAAVTITRLASRATVRTAGPVVEVAAPAPDHREAVARHVEAFVAEMAAVGVPEALARAVVAPDLVRVTIAVGAAGAAARCDHSGGRGPGAVTEPWRNAHRRDTTAGDVALEAVRDCLRAGLPAPLATCAPDGTPQISFISRVRYLDGERVATSRQSFNSGLAHLGAHPLSQVLVIRPGTGEEFRLDLRYLHAVTEGEEFDAMRAALDAVATDPAHRLRGVDVHHVVRCTPVSRGSLASAVADAADPLAALERFARRLEAATGMAEVQRQALDALDDVFGFRFAVLFAPDPATGRLVATVASGEAGAVLGAEADPAAGLIGIAASRRRVVSTGNLVRVWAIAGAAADHDVSGIPMSGLPGPRSAGAVPLVVGRDLLGVLYLESGEPYAFGGRVEALLRIVGAHTAAAFAARGAPAAVARRGAAPSDGGPPMEFVRYRADDTVLCDSAYVVKGVPGRILWRMLEVHASSGRVAFSNRELRLDSSLELPVGNDNLEARLLVLRRRLAEMGCGVTLEHVGRGRLELRLDRPAELTVVPAVGMRSGAPMHATSPTPLRPARQRQTR